MLLAFSAENARSFREPVELSLLVTRVSDPEVVREISWREGGKPIGVLPAAGIFGANASGKSNLLRAMSDMRDFVLHSFRKGTPGGGMPNRPFLLGGDGGKGASTYEVDLVVGGVRYEYGFRIDAERTLEEWARSLPHGRPALLFHRDGDRVQLGAAVRGKGRSIIDILRPNALFLSTAAAADNPDLLPLYEWFKRNLLLADENSRGKRQAFTAEMLDHDRTAHQVMDLLREADLGITGARRQELDPATRERIEQALRILGGEEEGSDSDDDQEIRLEDFHVRLRHQSTGGDVELSPFDESLGTLIWFGMAGPVVDSLREGSVLLADELDASLHPALVRILVQLFQSPVSNPRHAQLVFNSHDVTLMGDSGERVLARDQIWFTERDSDGGTRLYPLTDLDPRKGEAIGRRYLAGRYGATPIVSTRQMERIVEPEPVE